MRRSRHIMYDDDADDADADDAYTHFESNQQHIISLFDYVVYA